MRFPAPRHARATAATLGALAAFACMCGTSALAQRALAQRADPLTARGISRELARYRSARISDVRYDLALDVTGRDTARGRIAISFARRGSGDVIVDFRGPRVWDVRVDGAPASGLVNDGAHLRIPAHAVHPGRNTITLAFTAMIAPAGASVIRFHDATDGADYLYTLLVPSDANQLFPCFDQPDLKARTALTLTVPSAWTAVANGPVEHTTSGARTTTFTFERTRPLSTYLIAFAAGPWATSTRTVHGRPITMYVRASRAKEAESDSLIEMNGRAADWLATYFGVPFPWPKLDFVLAPAFPFGGMEHPGAIFYNENSFIYRERPTRPQLLGREATIYHEVAHQWFGDLVTMQWFDDLWLKEGFATYMAAKMQAALEPRSNVWETFYLRNKPLAYAVDRTAGTTPIWQELANLDAAKSNYGAIVYNKAPGVLKQLNYLVGDTAFRAGLHAFLTKHAYANATWRDLLSSVGGAAHRSLVSWGNAYILRPGMPVLQQKVVTHGDTLAELVLTQHPANALSGDAPWPIRTEVLLRYPGGRTDRMPLELTRAETIARFATPLPAPDFVFANAGDNAYALVLPDSASARWLETNVESLDDPLTRAMAWDALWELVRQRSLAPERFLEIVEAQLPRDRDEQIVASQLGHAARAATAYLDPSSRSRALPALEAMLRRGASDTTLSYGLRKPHLDALIRVARTPETLGYLDALLDSTRAAGDALRAPTRWAIVTRLLATGAPTAARRLAEQSRRDSTSEGKRQAFVAGAAVPDARVKGEYFARYLRDTTLNEDWATASLGAFNEPDQQALTLPYLKPALDTLPWLQRNRRIFFIGSWLDAFIGGQTSPEALATVQRFLAGTPTLPVDLRRKVLQTEDELERTVAIRAAWRAPSNATPTR